MSIIKLTSGEMRDASSQLHSHGEDYVQTYQQFAHVAEDLATNGMQGLAGPAVSAKVAELYQNVNRHGQNAMEKAQAVGRFADRTDEAEAERQSRVHAITSL